VVYAKEMPQYYIPFIDVWYQIKSLALQHA
jgi:hypothetical protein